MEKKPSLTITSISVEVAFATPGSQSLLTVTLQRGATAHDAIEQSGLRDRYPAIEFDGLPIGIWGQVVNRDRPVRDGDRVEIYRELNIDPREARRQLARIGRTMSDTED
ncbi:MAG: RnfH family protein [Gammaproteobacteria bacterium]|nr:RnfH family protein [Gammaproteobacteria bacterium]